MLFFLLLAVFWHRQGLSWAPMCHLVVVRGLAGFILGSFSGHLGGQGLGWPHLGVLLLAFQVELQGY